jgi:1-acyl-sn-glycerol-3-phosphate acyltransferase
MRSTRLAWAVFEAAFLPWMNSRIRLRVAGGRGIPATGRLLLCANHPSWWDGFLARRVQQLIRPGGSFHAVMLESELRSRPFLRPLGAIGVEAGSLGSGRRLLSCLGSLPGEAVVALFPQGRILPGASRRLDFRPGVARIAAALDPATVVPVGIRVLSGRSPRSDALISVGRPISAIGRIDAPRVEDAVGDELDAIDAFVERWGEDAAETWPSLGDALPRPAESTLRGHHPWISRN